VLKGPLGVFIEHFISCAVTNILFNTYKCAGTMYVFSVHSGHTSQEKTSIVSMLLRRKPGHRQVRSPIIIKQGGGRPDSSPVCLAANSRLAPFQLSPKESYNSLHLRAFCMLKESMLSFILTKTTEARKLSLKDKTETVGEGGR
jgi:hypothetical protein